MNRDEKIRKLVNYINSLNDFSFFTPIYPYGHMGATITDTILQAGLTWETTVKPRIDKVKGYKAANTTTGFLALVNRVGIKDLLDWSDDEKPNRIIGLTRLLAEEMIETEGDLKDWLADRSNRTRLLKQRGIGNKTLDYITMLAGTPSVAVDRHINGFLKDAGVDCADYFEAQDVIVGAANMLGVAKHIMDHSIWKYKSS